MLSPTVMEEIKRIILESEVTKEDDQNWPSPDREGRQELEIKLGNEHIAFNCAKIGSLFECSRESRSRRSSNLLLSRSRFKMSCLFVNYSSLQD